MEEDMGNSQNCTTISQLQTIAISSALETHQLLIVMCTGFLGYQATEAEKITQKIEDLLSEYKTTRNI